MSDNRSIALWICSLIVASLTTGQMLRADNTTALPSQDKVVPIKSGNGVASIKVQDPDPYKNLHVPPPETSNDPSKNTYDPTKYSMNQTSSLANKQFSAQTFAISKNGNSTAAFDTKPYGGQLNAADTGKNKGKFTNTVANDATHADSQFNKNYATPTSAMASDQSKGFSKTSKDQNREAVLGGDKTAVYDAKLSKQYLGPGAQHVPDGLVKENKVIEHISDLPNRPLTIDEVRGLIDHGIKPDTTEAPDAPSKAINDPDYKPEASPAPPGAGLEDDKNNPLPSPGAMAQPPPENSDSLPQH